MLRLYPALALAILLSACASQHAVKLAQSWAERSGQLSALPNWHMQGRAAAAIDNQGWQASLEWQQTGADAAVKLAGPLGIGATSLRLTAAGLSVDHGAAAGSDANELVRERMGFTPPFADLRYWLLGVPAPQGAADVQRDAEDRAARIIQNDWTVDYSRYVPVNGDVLPALLTLRRDNVRVRIIIDHWDLGI